MSRSAGGCSAAATSSSPWSPPDLPCHVGPSHSSLRPSRQLPPSAPRIRRTRPGSLPQSALSLPLSLPPSSRRPLPLAFPSSPGPPRLLCPLLPPLPFPAIPPIPLPLLLAPPPSPAAAPLTSPQPQRPLRSSPLHSSTTFTTSSCSCSPASPGAAPPPGADRVSPLPRLLHDARGARAGSAELAVVCGSVRGWLCVWLLPGSSVRVVTDGHAPRVHAMQPRRG